MTQPKGEIDQRPRRFYKSAAIEPTAGGWTVCLDGKALRTPARRALVLPTPALAETLAEEWRRQEERIDLLEMDANRLANVALDRTPIAREELAAEAARYAETDLLAHVADRPAALKARQTAVWTPLRAWGDMTLGVRLIVVEGVMPVRQPSASLDAVRRHALMQDDFRLTGLAHAIGLFGSAILGLAVEQGRLTASEALEAANIDEAFQASIWGQDAEAARRTDSLRREAKSLDLWFQGLAAPVEDDHDG